MSQDAMDRIRVMDRIITEEETHLAQLQTTISDKKRHRKQLFEALTAEEKATLAPEPSRKSEATSQKSAEKSPAVKNPPSP